MPDRSISDFPWKNVRILVTDDEPEMREIFATWLRNLGCQVAEAGDGLEALEKARQETFDVIVTDVRMPRLDGVELAKRLGEAVEYTPVLIFVSGFHDLPALEAHELGIEAILSKPCAKKQLIQSVRASLLRRQLLFANTEPEQPPSIARLERSFSRTAQESRVAIGRGGFSMTWEVLLALESQVSYSLDFAQGVLRKLQGAGIVRWVETVQRSRRVGIEFTNLTEQTRNELLALLGETHPRSFIPKDCPVSRSAANALP